MNDKKIINKFFDIILKSWIYENVKSISILDEINSIWDYIIEITLKGEMKWHKVHTTLTPMLFKENYINPIITHLLEKTIEIQNKNKSLKNIKNKTLIILYWLEITIKKEEANKNLYENIEKVYFEQLSKSLKEDKLIEFLDKIT